MHKHTSHRVGPAAVAAPFPPPGPGCFLSFSLPCILLGLIALRMEMNQQQGGIKHEGAPSQSASSAGLPPAVVAIALGADTSMLPACHDISPLTQDLPCCACCSLLDARLLVQSHTC